MAKKSNKKKNKAPDELQFKKRFLGAKMYGNIKGLELPKLYKDFTQADKLILYWHNPPKTEALFIDVSFIGPRKLTNEETKIKAPIIEDGNNEENNDTDGGTAGEV
jgi:hypothetical protein